METEQLDLSISELNCTKIENFILRRQLIQQQLEKNELALETFAAQVLKEANLSPTEYSIDFGHRVFKKNK